MAVKFQREAGDTTTSSRELSRRFDGRGRERRNESQLLLDLVPPDEQITPELKHQETKPPATTTFSITFLNQTARAKLIHGKHCGGGGFGQFRYDLQVVALSLDADGFVVDNDIIQGITRAWDGGFWVASCEILAGGLIHYLHHNMYGRAFKITARVHNNTGNVVVVWHRGTELPPQPRRATPFEIQQERLYQDMPTAYDKSPRQLPRQRGC